MSPLRTATVAEGTYEKYMCGMTAFLSYLDSTNIDSDIPVTLDSLMDDWINALFAENPRRGARQTSLNAICALELLIPKCKPLRAARSCCKGWDKMVTKCRPPPMSWSVMNGLACEAHLRGEKELGLALRFLHAGYLGANEALRLNLMDIVLPGDVRLALWKILETAGIRLRLAKTGAEQFVSISDPVLLYILPNYMHMRRTTLKNENGKVFTMQYASLRLAFMNVVDKLGLSGTRYSLHSLRHGGATCDSMMGVSIDEIVRKGRWRCSKTATIYLQEERALLLSASIPSATATRLKLYERAVNVMLSQDRERVKVESQNAGM